MHRAGTAQGLAAAELGAGELQVLQAPTAAGVGFGFDLHGCCVDVERDHVSSPRGSSAGARLPPERRSCRRVVLRQSGHARLVRPGAAARGAAAPAVIALRRPDDIRRAGWKTNCAQSWAARPRPGVPTSAAFQQVMLARWRRRARRTSRSTASAPSLAATQAQTEAAPRFSETPGRKKLQSWPSRTSAGSSPLQEAGNEKKLDQMRATVDESCTPRSSSAWRDFKQGGRPAGAGNKGLGGCRPWRATMGSLSRVPSNNEDAASSARRWSRCWSRCDARAVRH